jgi:hypothetical protein
MKTLQLALALLTWFLLCTATPATAGPFGTKQGMTVQQLRAAGSDLRLRRDDVYVARRLPRNLDGIDFYEMWIDPALGLCKLRAVGKTIESNDFGDQTKRAFTRFEELLEEVYGPKKKFDFLQSGSIWDDDNDWSMALSKEERTLSAYWDESEGSRMKDSITGIQLAANGLNARQSYIDITYEFAITPKCMERTQSKNKSVL